MVTARISWAGLSPLCERIVQRALKRRRDIQVVRPWTSLTALSRGNPPEIPEFLLIPLMRPQLPDALRALLSSAPGLRIVALGDGCRSAVMFEIKEHRDAFFDRVADDLCTLLVPRRGHRPKSFDPGMGLH